MIYLLIVSIIWALSFGLIKGQLSGLDSHFIAFARLLISFVFFAAFLRFKRFSTRQILTLAMLGAVQFGLMYIFYIYSYNFLKAWQIALFTIFTPIYVTLINDLLNRRFNTVYFGGAFLSILGAGIIVSTDIVHFELKLGFVLIQVSNLCFAAGQIYYKKIKSVLNEMKDVYLFAWLYFGAIVISGINAGVMTNWSGLNLTATHIYTLLYLGILASGICFFLWNIGATKVNAGTLAVFNNLKVPLGMAFAILIFGESGDYVRMFLGGIVILVAFYITEHFNREFT